MALVTVPGIVIFGLVLLLWFDWKARASLQLPSSEIIYEFMGWQCRFEDHSRMPSKCKKRAKLELMIIWRGCFSSTRTKSIWYLGCTWECCFVWFLRLAHLEGVLNVFMIRKQLDHAMTWTLLGSAFKSLPVENFPFRSLQPSQPSSLFLVFCGMNTSTPSRTKEV